MNRRIGHDFTAENQRSEVPSALIGRLATQATPMAHAVARDVALGDEEAEAVVRRFLDMVGGGPGLRMTDQVRLRHEGAAAARGGRALALSMDAYLSTSWVVWDHALQLRPAPDRTQLGALGAALLRAGDDIAAALSDGYTAAERALAATAGATRQAILDDLLAPTTADPAAVARTLRRAALAGLDVGSPHHLLVLRASAPGIADAPDDLVDELGRRLARDPARRPHLVGARVTDVVVIAPPPWRDRIPFGEVTRELPGTWWAVVAGPEPLEHIGRTYAEATDGLRVAPIVRPVGSVTPLVDLALERALVADPELSAMGAARWLEPLGSAIRGGRYLVPTLEAWFATGMSVTASARLLGVAPRTVSYRLDRIRRLLGVPALDPMTVARLSAAILVRRLLASTAVPSDA